MIQVLHLTDTYRIGGPGKTIINSAKYIDPGFRVHVSSFTSLDAERNEFASAVRDAGIPYLELRETGRFNPCHVARIRQYVLDHKIGLLHTHGYRTDVMGFLATRGLPVAIVTTHHGWIRNTRRQMLFTRLALRLCARFHGVELVSEQMRRELPSTLRHSSRVSVVHNGIVLGDYAPAGLRTSVRAELGVQSDDIVIGVIGRMSVEKGQVEMLDAMRSVREKVARAVLLFAGEGALRPVLERRAQDLGLDGRVRFVEHRQPVQPLYEAIDLLASPSRTEGLSNVILEALTFGVPVVATKVGGNPEIVEDGVSGLLVPARDPETMASALVRVLTDADLRSRLVSSGRRRVCEQFSFDARMRREERFYRTALALAGLAATVQ